MRYKYLLFVIAALPMFSAVADDSPSVSTSVIWPNSKNVYKVKAQYKYKDETNAPPLSVERQFEFILPHTRKGAAGSGQLLVPDAKSMVTVYESPQGQFERDQAMSRDEAMAAASEESEDTHSPEYQKVFNEKYNSAMAERIEQYGSVKTIDCRKVAMEMVIDQITKRLETVSLKGAPNGETRYYVNRDDSLDIAIMMRNLSNIRIVRGDHPGVKCTASTINDETGEVAECGELLITYKPVENRSGALAGKAGTVFDIGAYSLPINAHAAKDPTIDPTGRATRPYSSFMSKDDFRRLHYINACGLRDALKGQGRSKSGLADKLEDILAKEREARVSGSFSAYTGARSSGSAYEADGSIRQAPDDPGYDNAAR